MVIDAELMPATSFTRYSFGPSFFVAKLFNSSNDVFPPARITDLAIESYDSKSNLTTLTFTMVTDDYGSSTDPESGVYLINSFLILFIFYPWKILI